MVDENNNLILDILKEIDNLKQIINSTDELEIAVNDYINACDDYYNQQSQLQNDDALYYGMDVVELKRNDVMIKQNHAIKLYNNINNRISSSVSKSASSLRRSSLEFLGGYTLNVNFVESLVNDLNQLKSVLNSVVDNLKVNDFQVYTYTVFGFNPRTPRWSKTIYFSRLTNKIINNINILANNVNYFINKIEKHKDNIIKFERGEVVEITLQSQSETDDVAQEQKVHVLQRGESLSMVAAKYNMSWMDIYKANKDLIGNNPSSVVSGMKLVIPGLMQTKGNDSETTKINSDKLPLQQIESLTKLRAYKDVMSTNWNISSDSILKDNYGAPIKYDNEKGHMVDKNGSKIRMSSDFGWRILRGRANYHTGIDLVGVNEAGTDIQAIGPGIVIDVVNNKSNGSSSGGGYGNYVQVLHEQVDEDGNVNYVVSLYAHMQNGSSSLKVGDVVNEGDVVGRLGNSGNSTGAHLHLEMAKTDITENDLKDATSEEILGIVKRKGLGISRNDYYDLGTYYKNEGLV